MSTGELQRQHRFTLPNGLRVVLDSRFPQPRVAVAVHYGTGFRSERPGRAGFAHLFEHLMFRGSASLPGGRFYDHVHRFGAIANGTTHQDYTDYYQVVPAQALERALFAEADRMRAPRFTEASLSEQLRGVEEEIHQAVHCRPYGGFPWPLMPQVLFSTFTNAHDGYGEVDRLRTTTLTDCAEFFAAHYAPGNAVLTVVGAASPEETRSLVERHFGDIPARLTAPTPALAEPRPDGMRWVECTEAGVKATALAIGHRLPDPAADLPGYLGHAVLARLTSEQGPLARGLPAVSTSCGFFGPLDARDPDALVVTALLPPGAEPKECVAAVSRRWADWSHDPPAEAVRRTVRLMLGEHYRRHGDLETRCRALGRLEILFGDAGLLDRIPDHLAAVGPSEVAAAASELTRFPASVLVIRPGSSRTRPEPPLAADSEVTVKSWESPADEAKASPAPRSLPPYGAPCDPDAGDVYETTLGNGLRVVAVSDRRAPGVEARLRMPLGPFGWRAPAAADALLRRRLEQTRAGAYSADHGGSLAASVDGQWLNVTGYLPSEELPTWCALLGKLVSPQGTSAEPGTELQSPRLSAQRLMDDAVRRRWSAEHSGSTTCRSAANVRVPLWDPRGGVLVLLGDINPELAAATAETALSAWRSILPCPGGASRARPNNGRTLFLPSTTEVNLHLTVCASEPEMATPEERPGTDEAARYLATAAFGGYFGSRLTARLRGVLGEGCEAYSGRDVVLDVPRVLVRARITPQLADETIAGIRTELRRAGDEPFTEAEVEAAREFCAAQSLSAFDSPANRADLLCQITAAGRDPHLLSCLPQLLREVNAQEVARAGRELFATSSMDTVLLGAISPDLATTAAAVSPRS